ncbi:ABC transporter permease [Evansella sp. AB-P1]|uniref:ABC transporter permease n=1 Tax=Evansella sp. AB-P1 TaxID=3037653 RepID=UPI00241F6739|nr:ABC transporter permease [Evansella sp. AB-P1]MDG5788049.1 ABC transporter permease [Evansella sp. AB-P1]
MKSVFLLQWQRFRRAPILVLAMFLLTVVFVFFIAGIHSTNQLTVYTYSHESLGEEERDAWLDMLNESDVFHFEWMEESEARNAVATGEVSLALQLMEEDYRILLAAEEQTRYIVDNYVNQVFMEELRLREIENSGVGIDFRSDVTQAMEEPVLTVTSSSIEGVDGSFIHDERLQVLFGMTLFFVIYTILFSLMNVAEEKKWGTWNRLIVSPLRKWEVYLGHLLYCFMIGYAQIIVVFLLFQQVLGFDLGNRYGTMLVIIGCYTFAIVSLGMLLIGLVRTSQQLQAIIPIVATAIAMLGGAFWPIEIVTNDIMLLLSKGMPIFYAMDTLKGAAIYDYSVLDMVTPLSFMVLFGVVCMGVGINLMERR